MNDKITDGLIDGKWGKRVSDAKFKVGDVIIKTTKDDLIEGVHVIRKIIDITSRPRRISDVYGFIKDGTTDQRLVLGINFIEGSCGFV